MVCNGLQGKGGRSYKLCRRPTQPRILRTSPQLVRALGGFCERWGGSAKVGACSANSVVGLVALNRVNTFGLAPKHPETALTRVNPFGFVLNFFHGTLRSKYLIIIYLPKTCTIITITQNPSTQLVGTWTLRGIIEDKQWHPAR